jgi:hypothetical protein
VETLVKHPTIDPQQELLRQYCADAETLINTATSAKAARQLVEEMNVELVTEKVT